MNGVVDTTSIRSKVMKYRPPLSVLLGNGTQPEDLNDAIGIFVKGPRTLPAATSFSSSVVTICGCWEAEGVA